MISKVQLLVVFLAANAYGLRDHHTAAGYPGAGYGGYAAAVAATPYRGYADFASPPQPYSFGYDTVDEYGNRQFRSEQGDANNMKTGSYGYRDVNGLYRRVNYIADANGFRATVDTNEPGTAPGASADVVFNAAPVVPPIPAGVAASRPGVAPIAYGARGVAGGYSGAYSGNSGYGYAPYGGATGGYNRVPYAGVGYAPGGGALGGFGYGGYSSYGYAGAGYPAGRYAVAGYGGSGGWAAGHHGYRRR